MDKVGKIVLIIILIGIVCLLAFFGYRYYKSNQEQIAVANEAKKIEDEVETKYFNFLAKMRTDEDLSKYGISQNVSDVHIAFVEPTNLDTVVLVAQYEKDDINYTTLYYETDDGKIDFIEINVPSQLIYMYNEKTNSYNYYIEEVNPTTQIVSFESITNLVKNNGSASNSYTSASDVVYDFYGSKKAIAQSIASHLSETDNETYSFLASDVPNNIYDLSRNISNDFYKFDEVYIVPNVEKIDFTTLKVKADVDEFKNEIDTAFNKIKDKTQIVTDEVKKDIEQKIEIIKTKVNQEKQEIAKKSNASETVTE